MMIEAALRHDKPVRIGVNWGSLDQDLSTRMMDENARLAEPKSADEVLREALVVSALASARRAEELGLGADRIVISAKVSRVPDLVAVYRELARRSSYALHLGLTEAGIGAKGIVATTAALAILLQEGIGDTIRASLTPRPGEARTQEVIVCQELLQSLGLRQFAPQVAACPGCGRTTSTYFQDLADRIQDYLRAQMPIWKQRYPGVESMNVAVMGCIVNGPGESKHADIGISLPGTGESPAAPVFIDGEKAMTLRGERIAEEFQALVADYVERRFGGERRRAPEPAAPYLSTWMPTVLRWRGYQFLFYSLDEGEPPAHSRTQGAAARRSSGCPIASLPRPRVLRSMSFAEYAGRSKRTGKSC